VGVWVANKDRKLKEMGGSGDEGGGGKDKKSCGTAALECLESYGYTSSSQ